MTTTAIPERCIPVASFYLSTLLHGGLLCLAIYGFDYMTVSQNARHEMVAEGFSVLLVPTAAQQPATADAAEPETIQSNLQPVPEIPADKPEIVVAKKRAAEKPVRKPEKRRPDKNPSRKKTLVHRRSPAEKEEASEVTRQGANTRAQGTDRMFASDAGPQRAAAQDVRADGRGEAITYLAKVRSEVEKNKVYPRRARQMRAKGIAGVEIQLDDWGNIVAARLVSGSGNSALDDAAVEAVRRAKSSGPPPVGMGKVLTLQVEFSLHKR
ncbi:TPA: TonB family protein [Yersinia enterocolitica]|nr:energy transducer TonB [Yersinia enterocolitica]HEN3636374.1 energy transducer TonB [Yersinia enterocolitica]HEN3644495.1 energy transducer TonB [Yersinia enterocolitica]